MTYFQAILFAVAMIAIMIAISIGLTCLIYLWNWVVDKMGWE